MNAEMASHRIQYHIANILGIAIFFPPDCIIDNKCKD